MDDNKSTISDISNVSVVEDMNIEEIKREVTEQEIKQAEEFKIKGNALFTSHHYLDAVKCYEQAIECNPNVPAYYGNTAMCRVKLEEYGQAIIDATKAITLDKSYIKAYYRRADANLGLQKYKSALRDYKLVLLRVPNDADALKKKKECEKIVKEMQFCAAIESEPEKPMHEQIDLNNFTVDDSYKGPRFDDEKINLEFVEAMIAEFKVQKKIHKKYAFKIILGILDLLKDYPSIVDINVEPNNEVTVCGDIHGQFYDLCNIFAINGPPSLSNPYLFNGDFVDRGSFSAEVILTLFAYKLLYPNSLHLARETNNMNKMYGFQGEMIAKYENTGFKLCEETFNFLPLAHVINNKVFCVHGGLFTKDNVTLNELRNLDRNHQPPESGLMSEMLWSDPQHAKGRGPSKRGVGMSFGPDVTHKFLADNNLELLVRSHEVKDNGYEVEADGKLITIFSAPNYCDQMGNKGAFIRFDYSMKPKFTTFASVPHPNVKPMAYANPLMQYM